MKSAAAVQGSERFKPQIPAKKAPVVEVFDLEKAKQMVNDLIDALDKAYPAGAGPWIAKEMTHFTPETSSVDSAMATASPPPSIPPMLAPTANSGKSRLLESVSKKSVAKVQ